MKQLTTAAALALAALIGHSVNPAPARAETPIATGADQRYIAAAAKTTAEMVSLCKAEIATGTRPQVKAAAQKILSVEQENEEYIRRLEAQFNITHSP